MGKKNENSSTKPIERTIHELGDTVEVSYGVYQEISLSLFLSVF
jgi:hypothetical protein